MAKIVYGGFLHETNTFAPDLADWEAFLAGGGWPAMCAGDDVWPSIQGANIPAAGFVASALAAGHEVIPTIWCAASPSAHVEKNAYERICTLLLEGIKAALPVDAVYLDLHGAMVAQHFDDGEGELIRRVRECVGDSVPIVASLDLHANVTQQMLLLSDALVAYRTYPHIDMAETGARTFALLEQRLAQGKKPAMAVRRLPFLIPICWQSTDIEPARSLYNELAASESTTTHLSFATGFPAADFPECSPVIWAYAKTEAQANEAVNGLANKVEQAEAQFAGKLYTPLDAVHYAMQETAINNLKPIVIADAQDNPGAGSNSDTTGMLRALIEANAQDAAIGLIIDPDSAKIAHTAGEGATIHLTLGGKSGIANDAPLSAEFVVEMLSDGLIDATGPYYKGFKLNIGLSACLRIGGVRIVLASQKVQMADQSLFRAVGIEPTQQRILVVKSAVHFRADFTPIAKEIIVAVAPGSMPMVLEELPWKNLQPGIRIDPKGKTFR